MKHGRHDMIAAMNFDVVIIGGGLVGASLAVALRDSGLSLALVESQAAPAPAARWDSRIYAISPGSLSFDGDLWLYGVCRVEPAAHAGLDNGYVGLGAELEFS